MVPKKHADQLRESLASGEIAAVQSTLVADNTPLNSRVYTVRSGDTLSSIALTSRRKHQRFAAVEQTARDLS